MQHSIEARADESNRVHGQEKRVMKVRSSSVASAVAATLWALAAAPLFAQEPAAGAASPVRWSLGDVLTTALRNHPLVGQADAAVRSARARRGQAASITLPQVDGAAAWSWSGSPSIAGDEERTTATTVQGSVSQLLTDFGRARASVALADDLAAAAGEDARSSRVEVVFAAGISYFDVLRAGSVLGVRRETLRQRESLLRQAQAFFDAGVKARIDVVRAEANLFQARADATSAEHDLRTARLLLLNRMGIDGPEDFELAEAPSAVEAAGTIEDWLREAEEKHPDLRFLRLQLAAARNARLVARRGANPVVTATGRLGVTGVDELPSDRSWSVGAQLTVPVFNGYLTREQTAEADADLMAVEFALEERRRQLRLEVAQADQAIQDASERESVRAKEREAFAENLRLATGRYEAGAGDIIEMIDAQVQMAAAETALVQARFDRGTALAALYRALGRLPQ